MKNLRLFKIALMMSIILCFLTNCSKDEVSNTGTLKISFYKHSNFELSIYPIENTDVSISTIKIDENGNATKELNIGNYLIKIGLGSYLYSVGFQIEPNKTTTLVWNSESVPKVEK